MERFIIAFGLKPDRRSPDLLFAAGAGSSPVLHVTEKGEARFVAVGVRAESLADLEKLAAAEGVAVEDLASSGDAWPGGGKVVRLTDPDGHGVEVVAGQTPPFAGQGMCAGIRDATNLAWKLAAVLKGQAGEALLDTYETERRPHVRSVIDLALMMGRTVCILDPAAAAQRDAAMLAQRAAAPPDAPGQGNSMTPLGGPAVLAGSPGAGELFIQPWNGDQKWDDVAGDGAWLITREAADPAPGISVFRLGDPGLAAFAGDFSTWLGKRGADSVLVRPDRHVFGTGPAAQLIRAWTSALS